MVRWTITFSGRVQGVGFRYSTANIATGFRVSGFVQNQPDGTVLCVAEGLAPELERFVGAIRQAMSRHVSSAQIVPSPATGEFQNFTIRR
jgi:acylphosphatase